MREVITALEKIRRRSRAMLVGQRLAVLIASVAAAVPLLVLFDFVFRLPGTPRLALLLGGLAGLSWALWTYLRPALSFHPGLTDVALRAEATFPAVRGRLASSVEFATAGLDKTNPLAARSVKDTEQRLAGEAMSEVLRGGRTWRSAGTMLCVLGIVATCVAVNPAAAQTGLARLFAPYGATQWPARTGVVSLMDEIVSGSRVHPRGAALPLRAAVTKGEPDHVVARYRYEIDGRFGPWQRDLLTDQGNGVHERLVDTTADMIELYFETRDARTQRERITLAAPPAVHRAMLTVTPPSYAAQWFPALDLDLGPGLDQRAVTETPSLVGSNVRLRLELNKPIPVLADADWLRSTLGWGEGEPPKCTVDPEAANRWTLQWRLGRTRTLNLQLVDEYDLHNTEPIAYRIEAVGDRLPDVTVMQPESDEPVLRTAKINVVAEARDDVAVSTMGLQASRQQDEGSPSTEEVLWETSQSAGAPTATQTGELDLAQLDVTEGDVVLVRGVAQDVYEFDGQRHPEVRSPPRRLRIISELELARLFRRELGVVRQNAIRIEARQAELEDDVIDDGPQPGMERAQAQISERLAAQRGSLDEISRRMDTNRLNDEQLASLVQQAGDLLDYAGRAANRAVEAIERRQDEPRQDRPDDERAARDENEADPALRQPADADRPIVEAQEDVRQELTDLITLLDSDEDTWVAMRRLEDLLREQADLETQTSGVGQRTLGRTWEELTAAEQSELGRLAHQQLDVAEEGRQLIDDLRRRAEELQEADAQGAGGMRSAANRGEQQELSRDMENASDRVRQNQMRTAQAAQQSAQQTLQDMLSDIRETTRANAEELLRRLASLIQSIERLIHVQEGELASLAKARNSGDFSGRDRGMIRLNQNTQSVAIEARTAGQESRRIARVLDRAADAQGAAVVALRAAPMSFEDAQQAEDRSLELLREAATLAEELEEAVEEREVMRQRSAIVAAYRELAERQVALRGDTLELAEEGELNRRGLIEARGLGRNQVEIRDGLHDLLVSTPELRDSRVFSHVHDVMDDLSSGVTESLVAGDLSVRVTDRQQRIANSIGRLIEAMEDLVAPPQDFDGGQNDSGGQGGAGQMPVVPPIAELMLLRGMQEQVYNETRDLDRRLDVQAGERRTRLDELGHEQRQLLDLGREMAEALQNVNAPVPSPQPQEQP